jgi:signal transduction histidine kinase
VRRLANAILVLTIVMLAVALAWIAAHPIDGVLEMLQGDAIFDVILIGASVALAWLGRLIVRRSANRIGLAFLGVALGTALIGVTDIPLKSATVPYPAWLPLVAYGTIIGRTLVIANLTIVLLLFPTGSLPSPRWRWVAWLWLAGSIGVGVGALIGRFVEPPGLTNPIYLEALAPLSNALGAGGIALLVVFGAGIVSLVIKARQGNIETKALMRLLALVGSIALVGFATAAIAESGSLAGILGFALFLVAIIAGIPAALIIPVLKYRLYDIDLVIRKTVVVGLLAAFITAVYVGIVVGIGSLFDDTLTLQIAATAVVAIAFQPVRTLANRLANRLVYGKRATPYEVLARFADRIGDTYASEDVVGRIAHVIADGTGSEHVEVWLRLGEELRRTGAWPSDLTSAAVAVTDGDLPSLDGDRVAPVRHLGETLGAITITKPAGEPLTPNEADLLDRLADQSGLVLANVRLTADLEARLEQIARQAEELRASRQRIVAAQDEERRRLERNIHDGAQQHLVALAVKLRLARTMLERDTERGRTMLQEITGEIEAARETIHSLALGIYPPHLEAEGIAAALAAQYTRGTLPVHMDANGIGRHPIDIEAAVYFCVLEALQNAAKYAEASRIDVRLREADGAITFEVQDDGRGFDASTNGAGTGLAGMRDRLAIFGGSAAIRSAPGHGTIVTGGVPIPLEVPA